MKLIHNKTGFVVVEWKENKPHFKDRFLEKEMRMKGVSIPPFLREEFGGKSLIKMEDKDFPRAFKEVYCKYSLDNSDYRWDP